MKLNYFLGQVQQEVFSLEKKKSSTKEHFSNPSLEEEKRVWHSRKNLKRRDICFEIAEKKNVEPIEIAIAYVVHSSPLIFPLIGPRTVNELNSSIFGSQINLSEEDLNRLSIN